MDECLTPACSPVFLSCVCVCEDVTAACSSASFVWFLLSLLSPWPYFTMSSVVRPVLDWKSTDLHGLYSMKSPLINSAEKDSITELGPLTAENSLSPHALISLACSPITPLLSLSVQTNSAHTLLNTESSEYHNTAHDEC